MWSVRDKETGRILHTARNCETKEECIKQLLEYLSPDLEYPEHVHLLPMSEKEEIINNMGYEIFEHEKTIIRVEELTEQAWDWWHDECDYATKESIVLELYMDAKNISPDEVDW